MKSVTTKKQVARVHVPAAMPIELNGEFDFDKHRLAEALLDCKHRKLELENFLYRILSDDLGLEVSDRVKAEAQRLYIDSLVDSAL